MMYLDGFRNVFSIRRCRKVAYTIHLIILKSLTPYPFGFSLCYCCVARIYLSLISIP